MIITRAPLRISLGGGGTDLPSYYKNHEGFLISGAIDKYVYISLHKTFWQRVHLKYSAMEDVPEVPLVKHPIIREALKMHKIDPYIEISSMADIPAGTGLGSSGTFGVALLRALYVYNRRQVSPRNLAEDACHIEIDILQEPVGKQDQYISAFGGINCFSFSREGKVEVSPLNISNETLSNLEDNLLLFFTGFQRSASAVLKEQDDKTSQSDDDMVNNLHYVKEMGFKSKALLEDGDLTGFGELMNEHWEHKKKRSSSMSNGNIDTWYKLALKNGAVGGKIIGAGGGGFLMFYTSDKEKLLATMKKEGLKEVPFTFDFEGSKVLINEMNLK